MELCGEHILAEILNKGRVFLEIYTLFTEVM